MAQKEKKFIYDPDDESSLNIHINLDPDDDPDFNNVSKNKKLEIKKGYYWKPWCQIMDYNQIIVFPFKQNPFLATIHEPDLQVLKVLSSHCSKLPEIQPTKITQQSLKSIDSNTLFETFQGNIYQWISELNDQINAIDIAPNTKSIHQHLNDFKSNLKILQKYAKKQKLQKRQKEQQKLQKIPKDFEDITKNDVINSIQFFDDWPSIKPVSYNHNIREGNFQYIDGMESLIQEEINRLPDQICDLLGNDHSMNRNLLENDNLIDMTIYDINDFLDITYNLHNGKHGDAMIIASDLETVPREKTDHDFWSNFVLEYSKEEYQWEGIRKIDNDAQLMIKKKEKQDLNNSIDHTADNNKHYSQKISKKNNQNNTNTSKNKYNKINNGHNKSRKKIKKML